MLFFIHGLPFYQISFENRVINATKVAVDSQTLDLIPSSPEEGEKISKMSNFKRLKISL